MYLIKYGQLQTHFSLRSIKSKTCFYQSFFIFKEIATVEFHYKIISKVNLEVYFTWLTKISNEFVKIM